MKQNKKKKYICPDCEELDLILIEAVKRATKKNNWEKEFDKWFHEQWYSTREGHSCVGREDLKQRILKEIRKQLQATREATIKEVIKELPKKDNNEVWSDTDTGENGWNAYYERLKAKLSKLKGNK